jgi:hypothetical protein
LTLERGIVLLRLRAAFSVGPGVEEFLILSFWKRVWNKSFLRRAGSTTLLIIGSVVATVWAAPQIAQKVVPKAPPKKVPAKAAKPIYRGRTPMNRGKLPYRGGSMINAFPTTLPPRSAPPPPPVFVPAPTPTPAPLEMFPFAPQPFDASSTATDLSWMNEKPAGKNGFIRVRGEHFVDGQGKIVRFWGVNLSYQGTFPDKDKAPLIAGRLAKLGFNAVRLHQYETSSFPGSLWKGAGIGSSRIAQPREVDKEQLDKLDFFIAELIKRGLYINLNLHVGREAIESEGVTQARYLPEKDKGVNYYDQRLIALQNEFSRLMLARKNPYLGHALNEEPGLAMVEVTNENSLLGLWLADKLGDIPPEYQTPLRERWNVWLKTHYDEVSLRRAWTEWDELPGLDNLLHLPPPPEILNPDSPDGRLQIGLNHLKAWQLTTVAPAAGTLEADALSGATVESLIKPGLTVNMRTPGTIRAPGGVSWAFRLVRDNVPLVDNQAYALSFYARAAPNSNGRARKVALTISGGFYVRFDIGSDWRRYNFTFRPRNLGNGPRQIVMSLGNEAGFVQLSEIELHTGGRKTVPDEWTLISGVPLPDWGETQVLRVRRDFAEFLSEVEGEYAVKMRRFLKEDLGVRCPLWISQAQFGGWGGLWREAQSDAIDVHAYWKHPDLGEAGWAGGNWTIANISMVTAGEDNPLSNFGLWRLKGKPFVLSEWNSGAPNDFGAESLPMAAAMGAWQDWAAIFVFDYHARGLYERNRLEGAFSIDTHPAKIATAPAAALIFRRPEQENAKDALPGDVLPAWDSTTLTMPRDWLWHEVAGLGGEPFATPLVKTWREAGAARAEGLRGKTYVQFAEAGAALFPTANRAVPSSERGFLTDTKQIWWEKEPGLFKLNAPRSKLVIGYLGGRGTVAGELYITAPTSHNNWLCAALSSLDNEEIGASRKLLLTLAGKAENFGMGKGAAPGSNGAIASDFWGVGPGQIEGTNAVIRLQTSLEAPRVWALDVTGARTLQVPTTFENGNLQFTAGPQWKTAWYEIGEK